MWRFVLTLFLASCLIGFAEGSASAGGGVQCVRTQCEGPGQACIAALYKTYDACMAAGNQKCSGVAPADKFTCLKDELSPCATARNTQQAACLNEVQTCYTSCAPIEGERADFWCVGDLADERKAIFCEADPANPANIDVCEKQLSEAGALGGLTCDQLQ